MNFAFFTKNTLRYSLTASVLALASATSAYGDQSPTDVMVVFDASGSMWGQVDGTTKIEIARDVFTDLSQGWAAANQPVGLIAYGHRRKGDCGDIEMIARPSVEAASAMASTVQNLTPRGKTPLSQAVRMAAQELKFTENAATVVLLSDGIETCDLDPCAVGAELEQLGVDFTAHVIGFDIQDPAAKQQLSCLAENTGGTYRDARDAGSLSEALADVTTAQAAPPQTVRVHIWLNYADNTARPSQVSYSARNVETGEVIALATLDDTASIVAGPKVDLPMGTWVLMAQGDGGTGELEVTITEDTDIIRVPFEAPPASFALVGPKTFASDQGFTVYIDALDPPQQNATYELALLREGATDYSQNLTFKYLMGFDTYPVEHYFFLDDFNAIPGTYELVVVRDGNERLDQNYMREQIQLVDPADMEGTNLMDITIRAQYADGALPQGTTHWSFIMQGAMDAMAPITDSAAASFQDMDMGTYDVSVTVFTPDGEATGTAQLLLEADGPTDFTIELPRTELEFGMDQLQEPLSPGTKEAIRISGPLGQNATAIFVGLDGKAAQDAPIRSDGMVSIPADIAPGPYRVHVLRQDGRYTFVDYIGILPGSAQDIGDHATQGGEAASTMISPEELAAETGPNDLYFEPWKTCDGPDACRVEDPRVDLIWTVPANWATAEPYYYTTAGGAQADMPTVDLAPLSGGPFGVVLNPRQWDAQLGPCEEVSKGTLCRENSEVAHHLDAYAQIKSSLMGDVLQPDGWLPLGRSWTVTDDLAGGMVALLRFDEPTEKSETVKGEIMFTDPQSFGLTSSDPVAFEMNLLWDGAPVVYDISGTFEVEGKSMRINLRRPGDWDGTSNAWKGELGEAGSMLPKRIMLF